MCIHVKLLYQLSNLIPFPFICRCIQNSLDTERNNLLQYREANWLQKTEDITDSAVLHSVLAVLARNSKFSSLAQIGSCSRSIHC